jgi:hypothetical protein
MGVGSFGIDGIEVIIPVHVGDDIPERLTSRLLRYPNFYVKSATMPPASEAIGNSVAERAVGLLYKLSFLTIFLFICFNLSRHSKLSTRAYITGCRHGTN